MPRRGKYKKHVIPPDVRYNSVPVQQFINKVMKNGKKSIAEKIVYGALEAAAERLGRPPLEVFETAVRNASPAVRVVPKRVGGATYQVPVEVKGELRQSLAMRWIIQAARARQGRPMVERLTAELIDAFNNTGAAVRRREETHRMAEANRAFAHYAR
ncbi:30S ribosomal protein S7 [Kallotenue papyrolyticum]|uniref:30S ribosomal protein S7 n=1 Tax=Kallotenue papyrolyticum TaxID=1325125 RepID=UPI0004785F6A|nr:30S ribosomal protein S7 [Kallotenue papyrolyticum]